MVQILKEAWFSRARLRTPWLCCGWENRFSYIRNYWNVRLNIIR
ncbi:Hypothetical protein PP7435_CHR2-1418 [Komagataella phaffii CBS 7435]|uniref:Uncharacterized protein n=1 Tax=Komagataella phaffii (strain ATCC 76273 / CBS 7435 / CECT 11047 / NRRL Y-11430 / Wegner 21-1) TaxID=981350 RepID=A0A1G4KPM6_KOMPC|nr:Hypothetical protein BQ9382_C2-0512 [Komagataella phaffii CBS 7435]SCV11967.1 Hypothetical protein PP7435_CHR2-1418 [Komagataella phaffii CBS 7435]